jgi:flagellar hook-associated protein 3 FlgL
MRVPSNAFSETLSSQLQQLGQQQAQLQNQVSTGLRISNLSDDPSAAGRVLNLQTETKQIQQYQRNNSLATELTQTAYSALNSIKTISDRAGELISLGSGTSSTDSSDAYGKEANQMLEQFLQAANTKYNGQYIFGGTVTDTAPFAADRDSSGNITSITYQGGSDASAFEVGEGATISPYTSGTANQELADFGNSLTDLRDALDNQDTTKLASVQSSLQTSEDGLLATISNIGAIQTRLESNSTQNQARFASLQNLTSSDTDADIASATVKLTQTNTAYQAAMESGSKILQMSLLDYLR